MLCMGADWAFPARVPGTLRGALLPLQDTAASMLAQTQRMGMPQMPLNQAAGTLATIALAQDHWTFAFLSSVGQVLLFEAHDMSAHTT